MSRINTVGSDSALLHCGGGGVGFLSALQEKGERRGYCDTPVTVRHDCCGVATDAARVPVCFR